jgi:hypothetical protein
VEPTSRTLPVASDGPRSRAAFQARKEEGGPQAPHRPHPVSRDVNEPMLEICYRLPITAQNEFMAAVMLYYRAKPYENERREDTDRNR